MIGETCATCAYLEICPIYKVAREIQLTHVAPPDFGCFWHRTPKEYTAMLKAREEKAAEKETT